MTLHVGLVGSDGIVLACDKKVNVSREAVAYGYETSKIRLNESRNMLTCWAQYAPADEVAKRFLKIPQEKVGDICTVLESLGQEVFEQMRSEMTPYPSGDVILVSVKGRPVMYQLEINGRSYQCTLRHDKAYAGNNLNAALFFSEMYYERKPISELVPLAAHTIVSASAINRTGIKGLEVVRCIEGKFHFLTDKETADLTQWSQKLSVTIKRRLIFDYREVTEQSLKSPKRGQ